jgi:hypothetical protein
MALADIPADGQRRRLDSWKEIAEYLGRDVRTATRWESQGLPVQRVPGGKGSSVFALTTEIDAWLAGTSLVSAPPPAPLTSPPAVDRRGRSVALGLACALGAVVVGALIMARAAATPFDETTLSVTAAETNVSIADESGASRVIYQFAPGPTLVPRTPARVADLNGDGQPEILVAVSFYDNPADRSIRKGELLNLSTGGDLRWRFAFDDVLSFRDGPAAGPWVMADWQASPGASPARIAVAAHHYIWWASIVAVLDHDGRRLGAFANPGWVESLFWLDEHRLVIAGFNNARNEAMLGLVDTRAADGQAPGTAGTPFSCLSCPTAAPLFYATFPRSELNLLNGDRFNRAQVAVLDDRIQVTTSESANSAAGGIYDFDPDFRLVRSRYSESYWDMHRRLEIEGRLAHTRQTCPEREGPSAIHVWDAQAGWARVATVTR